MSDSTGQSVPVNADSQELRQRALEFLQTYRHGTDDAPYFVAQDLAQLPAPYAIALTAAICAELDAYERPRFARLLLTVAKGEYRSVFDRARD